MIKQTWRERMRDKFVAARKVALAEYDGTMITDGDGYFAFTADVDPDDPEHPCVLDDGTRFYWGTTGAKAAVDLVNECSESWLQEHHEDAMDHVDLTMLAQAQTLVDAALARVTTYYPDEGVAVVLPKAGGS